MSQEFLDFIEDILDAMDKAVILLKGVGYQQFEDDFRINYAAVRALEIIVGIPNSLSCNSPVTTGTWIFKWPGATL